MILISRVKNSSLFLEENMSYSTHQILTENLGNNAFAWERRWLEYMRDPILHIPAMIDGTLDDIRIGSEIVFEEVEGGALRSCMGLESFVRLSDDIVIFDNHNHALYFWIDAVRQWILQSGFELIHIDEHSDLWSNEHVLDMDQAIISEKYAWEFTNLSCNVGNYIQPAITSGLVGNMIRIENEYQIDAYMDYIPSSNSVLNLDLDIFSAELEHIPEYKKIQIIRNLLQKVRYVTIATSPYFIDQWTALKKLHQILQSYDSSDLIEKKIPLFCNPMCIRD